MIETTYEGTGKVGVVVPHGVLFRGASEGKIRKKVIEENLLEAGIVEDKFSYVATYGEIEENDFNLNIPRYVDTFEEEAEVDIATVQQEIETLEGELEKVQDEIKDYLTQLMD
jgi:type I restriction-modification system DNA methylase subunit